MAVVVYRIQGEELQGVLHHVLHHSLGDLVVTWCCGDQGDLEQTNIRGVVLQPEAGEIELIPLDEEDASGLMVIAGKKRCFNLSSSDQMPTSYHGRRANINVP